MLCIGSKDASMCLHRRKQGSIITAVVSPRSVLSTANGSDTKPMDPRWHRALPFGDLHALPCPCSLCLYATSSVYPCSPEPYSVLSHPQLLPHSGDVEGDRLVQKGTELCRSQKGLSTARTPGGPSSASWEWGDGVQLRPQPNLPRQQLPTVPVENRSSSVPAQGEVCPGPGEHHHGC